jgi:hypothetical protein
VIDEKTMHFSRSRDARGLSPPSFETGPKFRNAR